MGAGVLQSEGGGSRRRRRSRARPMSEINVTPFVDVMLVLLIIFMVTSSVVASQGKQVDLPGAEVSDTTPQGVTVTVSPDGEILVNDKVVNEKTLYPALEEALETEDAGKIKSAIQNLTEAAMKLGEAIYKAEQEKAGAAPEDMEDEGPSGVDDDIVDADFEDLDDDKRAS